MRLPCLCHHVGPKGQPAPQQVAYPGCMIVRYTVDGGLPLICQCEARSIRTGGDLMRLIEADNLEEPAASYSFRLQGLHRVLRSEQPVSPSDDDVISVTLTRLGERPSPPPTSWLAERWALLATAADFKDVPRFAVSPDVWVGDDPAADASATSSSESAFGPRPLLQLAVNPTPSPPRSDLDAAMDNGIWDAGGDLASARWESGLAPRNTLTIRESDALADEGGALADELLARGAIQRGSKRPRAAEAVCPPPPGGHPNQRAGGSSASGASSGHELRSERGLRECGLDLQARPPPIEAAEAAPARSVALTGRLAGEVGQGSSAAQMGAGEARPIVWARVCGFPWWPAYLRRQKRDGSLIVRFFATYDVAVLPAAQVTPFADRVRTRGLEPA